MRKTAMICLVGFVLMIFCAEALAQVDPGSQSPPAAKPNAVDQADREMRDLPGDSSRWESGKRVLKGHQPSFVKAWFEGKPEQTLEFSFNQDATEVTLHAPEGLTDSKTAAAQPVRMLLAEKSVVHQKSGIVVLSALDSQVVGKETSLETHPGNHRIGFWRNAKEYVFWDLKIPPGEYQAELVYSRASKTGTRVTVSIGDTRFPLTLKRTGSWYRYRNARLGSVKVPAAPSTRVQVRVNRIINGGVMNLKAVILTPKKPSGVTTDGPKGTVSFSDDIRPLLSDRCYLCHGPDEAKRSAGLRLDKRQEATEWAIVPGDAEASEVIARVSSKDPQLQMPTPDSHKAVLTDREVELLKTWINDSF